MTLLKNARKLRAADDFKRSLEDEIDKC